MCITIYIYICICAPYSNAADVPFTIYIYICQTYIAQSSFAISLIHWRREGQGRVDDALLHVALDCQDRPQQMVNL